ncbi:hypothetical protein [Oceanobacillus chungangensis]|uniref:Uncharacterized protein n=1 Tax=Oceanobacillus chungangensis TaxID=1229152 RepID=A0A3D8PJJ0_9BACI|nr:hypothetical protein [Oceanobacillus chungangensis]RDW16253.1 hypothetical protein CWR45_15375 [Oceanobacillus chungangensis]
MNKKKIYLLLTDTGTLFTRTIKLFTKKPYNHASIAFDSKLLETYSFGRKKPGNPFIGGFVKESVHTGLFEHARGAIFSCNVTEEQMEKLKQFMQQIESQKHCYKYNFIGLFALLLNKPITRGNAFFCSEFVATALHESSILHFSKPLSLITPHDLQQDDRFELIYEGPLTNLRVEPLRSTASRFGIV